MTHTLRAAHLIAFAIGAGAFLVTGCLPPRAYDPCSVNADCPAGTTCQQITAMGDRMCTAACSPTSGSCPVDYYGIVGQCISFDGGANFSCWQSCSSSVDCPAGYGCFTSDATGRTFPPICLPDRGGRATRRAYETCTASGECAGGLSCTFVNSRGMCTSGCSSSNDCALDVYGASARCISFGGAAFTCFQACNISAGGAECPYGWGCYNNDGSSSIPPTCLPN